MAKVVEIFSGGRQGPLDVAEKMVAAGGMGKQGVRASASMLQT